MYASTAHRFIAIVLVVTYLQPFITCVSGAYLQYQTTHLLDSLYVNALDTTFVIDSPGNVTLTPGRRETFFCRQHDGAPVATAIQWYNPEGRLVSRNSGDNVYQFVVDHGRVTYLNFISYNHSLKGKYECRVHHVNEFMETLHLHIVIPASLIRLTPVEWVKVCSLQPDPYIDYKELIIRNRIPALFPDSCEGIGLDVYIGALYVHTISGQPIASRRVYFEASNPREPTMRVPTSLDEEQEVIDSFAWDRKNFVYQKVGDSFDGTRDFKIFTPANMGSYGIPKGLDDFDGLIFIKKEPGGTDFTDFQIKGGQSEGYITSDNGNMGLYVDMFNADQGGWKVKITANHLRWDKFRITSADFPITRTPHVC